MPRALFIPKGSPLTIKCPICGCNQVEINGIQHGEERDFQEDGFQNAYASIEFIGKCGHEWTIQFCSNGDGKMYLNITYEKDGSKHFLLPLPELDEEETDEQLGRLGALFG